MKFIKYFSILIFLFTFSNAYSQQGYKTTDVVYTKEGSVFRGEIVAYTPGESLSLKISESSTIIIQDNRIKKIVQGAEGKGKRAKGKREYAFRERGLYNLSSVHIAAGATAANGEFIVDLGAHHVAGFQFNRFLGVGLGVGMDYYYIGAGQNIMPVYAEARGYFKAENFTPMYSLAAGYGFAFEKEENNITDAKGGFLLYPALGFRMGGSANANYFLDFGVKIQRATFTYQDWWDTRVNKMTYNRLVLRTGILF